MSVWSKIYERINWKDLPQRLTALAARNLNKMDLAIDTIDDRVIALDNGKVSSVTVTDTLPDGDTIATITVDGTPTAIKAKQPNESEMNVRSAMLLLSTTPIGENAPFVKRRSGGNVPFPALLKDKIIGASVVWNQLVKNGNFADGTNNWRGDFSVSDGKAVFTFSSADEYKLIALPTSYPESVVGHKYLIFFTSYNTPNGAKYRVRYPYLSSDIAIVNGVNSIIVNANLTTQFGLQMKSATASDTITIDNVMCFDLTAMFGSTIADYVYTLETQTAGSGIAWLKSYGFFTEPYYAYSSNKIESVSVSAKKNVGKNQLDLADISGTETNAYYHNISTDYKLKANVTYTLSFDVQTSVSPFNMSVGVGTESGSYSADITAKYNNSNGRVFITFTPTQEQLSQYEYLKIRLPRYASQTTFTYSIKDIQLELGSTATTYEPYTETTYSLDHTTLRGLFKLDANNNLYADGDIYNADGSGDGVYDEVDLGSLNWTYVNVSGSERFYTDDLKNYIEKPALSDIGKLLCEKYKTISQSDYATFQYDKIIAVQTTGTIVIRDTSYTDASALTLALNGVKAVYKKATASSLSLTPFTSLQNIASGGTEEFIDYGVEQGTRDVAIPVGGERQYYQGMDLPALPTASGNHNLQFNPSSGFSWS